MKESILSCSLFASIVDNIDIAIILHDPSGRIVDHNKCCREVFEVSENQLSGVDCFDLFREAIRPDGSSLPAEEYPHFIAQKTGRASRNVQMGIKTREGESKWISVSSQRISNEEPGFIFTTVKDVTSVIETQNNLNAIIRSMDEVVLEVNRKGKILNIWARDMSVVGFEKSRLYKNNIIDFISTPNKSAFLQAIETTLHSAIPYQNVYLSTEGPNKGKWFLVKFSVSDPAKSRLSVTISDITRQKNAEEEISLLNDRLILAARAGGVGLWEWNIESNDLHWDEKMYEIYGIAKESFEGKYRSWKNQVHPEDIPKVETEIQNALQNPGVFNTNFRVIRPNGEERIIKTALLAQKDKSGKPKRMIGTNWDITEEVALENALRESEEIFRKAFRHASIGISLVSPEGKWLEVNDALCEMVGYTREEMLKITFQDITHPEDLDIDLQNVQKVLDGEFESYQLTKRYLHKKGEVVWAILSVSLVRNPDHSPKFFIAQIVDITKEKRVEIALKISEKKFRSAFTSASAGMAITGPDGKWIEVNDAFSRILGYDKEELAFLTFRDVTHPDDIEKNVEGMALLDRGEIDSYTAEKRYLHKKGGIIWALLSVSLIKNEDNTPRFFISQVVDITPRKHLIEELETKNKILKSTTLDLENKVAQLEEFNGIIAHNVRGPVANLVQLFDYLDKTVSEEKKTKLLSMAKTTSYSILDTLNDLKEIMEIQMNKDVVFENCRFEDGINRIEQLLQGQITNRNAVIIKNLQEESLRYPKAYLENILYNLISNAIKYTAKNTSPRIKITTRSLENRIILEVKDNGLGIDLTRHGEQIFRYKRTFHEGFDSTGMGLFIVKNQVETFGGTITVVSEPGKGSVFTVSFKK